MSSGQYLVMYGIDSVLFTSNVNIGVVLSSCYTGSYFVNTSPCFGNNKNPCRVRRLDDSKNSVEENLNSLLLERGCPMTDRGGKTQKGTNKHRRRTTTGTSGDLNGDRGRDRERLLKVGRTQKLVSPWSGESGT